jgi:hypothetical protein
MKFALWAYRVQTLRRMLKRGMQEGGYSAGQGIPLIIWNPKSRHRVHKSLATGPITSYFNSVNIFIQYFFNVNFNYHPIYDKIFLVLYSLQVWN